MKRITNVTIITIALSIMIMIASFPLVLSLGKVEKLLKTKFYLHREKDFGSYRFLNRTIPIRDDNHTIRKFISKGRFDLPFAWITKKIPKDISLPLDYVFKFCMHANCSDHTYGALVGTIWRYRDETETFLYRTKLSTSSVENSSSPEPIIWFEWINKTLSLKKDDRLILKLHLKAYEDGWFWLGYDCQQYPSYIVDPETVTLRPIADGDKTEWNSVIGASSHWEAVNDTGNSDNDTTYIKIPSTETQSRIDLFHIADNVATCNVSFESVTVYYRCRGTSFNSKRASAVVKIGGTEYKEALQYFSTSYVTRSNTWGTNPNSGFEWTRCDLDSLQIGVQGTRGVGGIPPSHDETRCTQVYAVVEFEVPEEDGNDYVDNNDSDVDGSEDQGTHSCFCSELASDNAYDVLSEEQVTTETSCFDFQTFTQVDPHGEIDVNNASHISIENLARDVDAYVYYNYSASPFTDFTHQLDIRGRDTGGTAGNDFVAVWVLSDYLDDIKGLVDNSRDFIALELYEFDVSDPNSPEIRLRECYSGTNYIDSYVGASRDTWYYVKILKTATLLKAALYSTSDLRDAGDATDGDIKNYSLTLHQDYSFDILYACDSLNSGASTRMISGDVKNLCESEVQNYRLDLEVQWTNCNYTRQNEELCIKTGSIDDEAIEIYLWNMSSWHKIFDDLNASSWNNISISSYLWKGNLTLLFADTIYVLGASNDTTQDQYYIDCVLLHTWTPVVGAWHKVESWYGELITRSWEEVETWLGEAITRSWEKVENWHGELWTRSWTSVEEWYGLIATKGWRSVENWYGILQHYYDVYFIAFLFILALLGLIIVISWEKKET